MKKIFSILRHTGCLFLLLVIINIICFIGTKVFAIGFTDITFGEYIIFPLLYTLITFAIALFLRNKILWGVPALYGIFCLIVSFLNPMNGQEVIMEINERICGIFNFIQFFIQKLGLNTELSFYIIHILTMFFYQIIIGSVCLHWCKGNVSIR